MVTNQMMSVQIGKEHTVKIGHLTQMGKLNDVLEIGNSYREKRGLKKIEIREWLTKENTWEFIIKVFNEKSNSQDASLDIATEIANFPRDTSNRVAFGEVLKTKKFSSVIKSQRGGKPENRGYWANLYLLLDLASYLDVDLKYEMYDIFINQKLLQWRDTGGDNFKEFNKVIDTLPDRIGKNNTYLYQSMSLILRKKLGICETRGYNEKDHNSPIQEKRAKWLDRLTAMIDVGLIQDYDGLQNVVLKMEA